MFHKASTHIRPLLRLPSHAPVPTPDLFTPNPSLLHHLPSSASSSSAGHLVVQGQAAAASGSHGAAGGAGRAGAGAGAGSGGAGYTGHARAFLSLPHTSADPSSSGLSDDRNSNREKEKDARRARASLIAQHQHRYGRNRTRIVQMGGGEGEGKYVRKELEARAGKEREWVSLIELEENASPSRPVHSISYAELEAIHEGALSTSITAQAPPRSPSRSKLVGPSPRSASPAIPPPSHSGLHRSRTTIDLWQVGVSPSRPVLGLRAMSSASLSNAVVEDQLDIDLEIIPRQPRQALRALSQPNRVLMDLAGRDVPTRTSRRSYATLAESQPATDEAIDYSSNAESSNNETDRRVFTALQHASANRRKDLLLRLVEHYRTPRDGSVENPSSSDEELSLHLPLPAGYTVGTYNACLSGLIDLRSNGESIAPILEIYNEMLSREIIPNGRTYACMIQALCLREKDVWSAVQQRADEKKWGVWKQRNLNVIPSQAREKDEVIAGYRAENNFDSALKLFRNVLAFHSSNNEREYRFYPSVYNYLLDAMASQDKPDPEVALEIFRQSQGTDTPATRSLYRHLFAIYASAGDLPGFEAIWAEFEQTREDGQGLKLREWKDVLPGRDIEQRQEQVEQAQLKAYEAAIRAFIKLDRRDVAIEIMERLTSRIETKIPQASVDQLPRPTSGTFGTMIVALAEAWQFSIAREWYQRYLASTLGDEPLRGADLSAFLDHLVLRLRWKDAMDVYVPILEEIHKAGIPVDEERKLNMDSLRIKRIITAILGSIKNAESYTSEVEEAFAAITKMLSFRKILIDPDLARAQSRILIKINRFDLLPAALDEYGGPFSPVAHGQTADQLYRLLGEICQSEIGFIDLARVLASMEKHWIRPAVGRQQINYDIVKRYAQIRSTPDYSAVSLGLDAESWYGVVGAFARLATDAFIEGDYDGLFESLMTDLRDLKESGVEPLALEDMRLVQPLADRLFNRFGSERARMMLQPLLGEEAEKVLSTFVDASGSEASGSISGNDYDSAPSTPMTEYTDASSSASYAQSQPQQPLLRIDHQLSRRVDEHTRRGSSMTPLDAYSELQAGLSRHVVPTPEVISRLISPLGQLGPDQSQRVMELYNLAQSIFPLLKTELQPSNWRLIEDSMISANCHMGYLEQAGLHRARLVEAGMSPSAEAFATMIAHTKDTTDDALVARELWAESQAMGVRPNLYLYNTIISKLSKARKAEMALELFGEMKARGLAPSSVTYGAIINACCRVGDAESAETLFNEMASQPNFRARVPPYNTMMQFYLQTKPDRERVLYYYNALRQSGVQPSAHTYKLLLDTYGTLPPADLTAMERVFNDLCHDRSVTVQGTHWASLISAYGISAGDVNKALEVFDIIPTHPAARGVNAHSEPVVWEAILNVLATKGTIEQLELTRQRMIESGTRATAYVYNVLITGYARAGDIQKAREVFESMGDSITGVAAPNNHPQLLTSSGHVKPSTKTNEPTPVVYREPSTYESMIKAELLVGDGEMAEGVLRRMEERRYPVAVFMRAKALLDGQPSRSVESVVPPRTFAPVSGTREMVGEQEQVNLGYSSTEGQEVHERQDRPGNEGETISQHREIDTPA